MIKIKTKKKYPKIGNTLNSNDGIWFEKKYVKVGDLLKNQPLKLWKLIHQNNDKKISINRTIYHQLKEKIKLINNKAVLKVKVEFETVKENSRKKLQLQSLKAQLNGGSKKGGERRFRKLN